MTGRKKMASYLNDMNTVIAGILDRSDVPFYEPTFVPVTQVPTSDIMPSDVETSVFFREKNIVGCLAVGVADHGRNIRFRLDEIAKAPYTNFYPGITRMKTRAFLLFGGFTCGRYPEFLDALARRDLTPLVIDEKNPRTLAHRHAMESNPSHPFRSFAEYLFVDPLDHIDILRNVQQWSQTYDIRGLYTIREAFVEAVGRVGDWMGLPNIGLRAPHVCRNKFLQRLYLFDFSPKFTIVSSNMRSNMSECWNQFPAVVKPLNRQASSGVQRVDDGQMLTRVLRSSVYDAEEVLLVEESVDGPEFSVETLVQQGRIIFAGITQKRTNSDSGQFFVEMAHTVPAIDLSTDEKQRLLRTNSAVIERLALQNGIAHAEYKVSPKGNEPILMEIAARNPGDGILPLYQLATGVPMEDALIGIALGEPTTYPEPSRYARQVYFNHSRGQLSDVRVEGVPIPVTWYRNGGSRPRLNPSSASGAMLREIIMDKQQGATLTQITQSSDRTGSYIFDAPTPETLNVAESIFGQKIEVIVHLAE